MTEIVLMEIAIDTSSSWLDDHSLVLWVIEDTMTHAYRVDVVTRRRLPTPGEPTTVTSRPFLTKDAAVKAAREAAYALRGLWEHLT